MGADGFPGDSDGRESTRNAWDPGSIPGVGKIPWRRAAHGNLLQYSCLENPMDREKPGGLQSMGSQRVGHNWVTDTHRAWELAWNEPREKECEQREEGNSTRLAVHVLKGPIKVLVAKEESGHPGGDGSSPFSPPILHVALAQAPINMREMFSSDCWGMLLGYTGL